jgi:16S rRNA (cytosine967-C5)-methyltransferase
MTRPKTKKAAPATPRSVALDLIEAVLARHHLLDDALDAHPAHAGLEDRDRGFVRLLVATALRRLGQIDDLIEYCVDKPIRSARARDALRLGICQLLFLDTPPHAAISTTVDLVKGSELAGFAGLLNAVLRRLDRDGRAMVAEQDAERLNTPDWLWRSWVETYGEETTRAITAAHQHEAPIDITAFADPADWTEKLEATLLLPGTLRRPAGGGVTGLPGFAEGAWWVQDFAASLPARLLGEVRGRDVADLCAAPGGKALQLAAAGARLTAVDRSAKRLGRFADNLARLHLEARIVEADAGVWIPDSPLDAVLLDAPCSATGTLRRHPDVARLKSPADVTKLAETQARLLQAAIAMLKPGGTLVYCVCSLQPEEGIHQVERLLASGTPLRRRPITAAEVGERPELLTADGDLRTLPCHLAELGGMDAFFAARLDRV